MKRLAAMAAEYAPFLFTDGNHRLRVYRHLDDLYEELMKEVVTMFPSGYIDLPLLVARKCEVNLTTAQAIVGTWDAYGLCGEIQTVAHWEDETNTFIFFRKLIRALHASMTDSTIQSDCYQEAFRRFEDFQQHRDAKERTLSGDLIDFV